MTRPRTFKLVLTACIIAGLAIIGYLGWRYQVTQAEATRALVNRTAPLTPSSQASSTRAFVKIYADNNSATRGGTWTITIDSNDWGTCLIDLYKPDQSLYVQSKDAAKATRTTTVGRFAWTWHVPTDIPTGKWTARALCGTYENLAINDQSVDVQ